MRALITGGAGFVGSHLCDALIARYDEVVCVDNLSTGVAANISHLIDHPAFTFIDADVTTNPDVPGPFDAVAHLASPASPPEYQRLALETLAVGSRGSEFALEVASRWGARVILASTSEIYGEPLVHPQPEEYWGNVNSVGPRSMYDEAKRYAEALFAAYRRSLGTNTGIVRIFNTFGPRLRPLDGRVVSNFIHQAIGGESVTIYGDGRQTRSFCYVSDLVAGLVAMLDSDASGPINLGNPVETSVGELAELIISLTGSQSVVSFHPRPVDDPTVRRPDIRRAGEDLAWEPSVDLIDGLRRTIDWQLSERRLAAVGSRIIRLPDHVGARNNQSVHKATLLKGSR
jgi:nucleoside-diphosphate-sugar epimerase